MDRAIVNFTSDASNGISVLQTCEWNFKRLAETARFYAGPATPIRCNLELTRRKNQVHHSECRKVKATAFCHGEQ